MINTHAGVEEYNRLMDAAGHRLLHERTLSELEIATLVSRFVEMSLREVQEERRPLPDGDVINTGIYQISCRNCAEAILNTILDPNFPDPDFIMNIDILAGDDEVFTRFTNMITERGGAAPARRGERAPVDPTPANPGTLGMYINIC